MITYEMFQLKLILLHVLQLSFAFSQSNYQHGPRYQQYYRNNAPAVNSRDPSNYDPRFMGWFSDKEDEKEKEKDKKKQDDEPEPNLIMISNHHQLSSHDHKVSKGSSPPPKTIIQPIIIGADKGYQMGQPQMGHPQMVLPQMPQLQPHTVTVTQMLNMMNGMIGMNGMNGMNVMKPTVTVTQMMGGMGNMGYQQSMYMNMNNNMNHMNNMNNMMTSSLMASMPMVYGPKASPQQTMVINMPNKMYGNPMKGNTNNMQMGYGNMMKGEQMNMNHMNHMIMPSSSSTYGMQHPMILTKTKTVYVERPSDSDQNKDKEYDDLKHAFESVQKGFHYLGEDIKKKFTSGVDSIKSHFTTEEEDGYMNMMSPNHVVTIPAATTSIQYTVITQSNKKEGQMKDFFSKYKKKKENMEQEMKPMMAINIPNYENMYDDPHHGNSVYVMPISMQGGKYYKK